MHTSFFECRLAARRITVDKDKTEHVSTSSKNLAAILETESRLVAEESMKVLGEFENLEDLMD